MYSFKNLSNYDKLLEVANAFRFSQGFYSRMYANLIAIDDDSIEQINEDSQLKECSSILNVVLAIEG